MSGQHKAGPAVAVEEPRRGAGDVTPEAATRRGDFTVALLAVTATIMKNKLLINFPHRIFFDD